MKNFKKITSHKAVIMSVNLVFIAIFCIYWTLTVIFTMPESSVIIGENYKEYNQFNQYLFQRWSFFAPPPKANRRLTYSYFYLENNLVKRQEVEIFSEIFSHISKAYPFNDLYINYEWMFFSKTEQIQEIIRKYAAVKKINDFKNEENREEIKKLVYKSDGFQFILDHALIMKDSLGLPANTRVQIMLSDVPIKKYKDRYMETGGKEIKEYFFLSDLYHINNGKWEI